MFSLMNKVRAIQGLMDSKEEIEDFVKEEEEKNEDSDKKEKSKTFPKKRISNSIEKLLNEQIVRELESSYLYYSISKWCLDRGFFNSHKLFDKYANEEKTHADKLIDYLFSKKATYVNQPIETLFEDLKNKKSLKDMFEASLEHEYSVTDNINDIVNQCLKDNDNTTRVFLDWYVEEQTEEEDKFINVLDKYSQLDTNLADFLIDTHYIPTLV